jgi:hypothetical protein
MADTQISNLASATPPSRYVVANNVELLLKAVHAEFDGSGAAGPFLPAVVITSDSGHRVAVAVDQSVSVSAGGSADASFFRGVKHAAAVAATSRPDVITFQGPLYTVPGAPGGNSGEVKLGLAPTHSTTPGMWSFVLDGASQIVEVHTTTTGYFLMNLNFVYQAPAALQQSDALINTFGNFPGISPIASMNTASVFDCQVAGVDVLTAGTGIIAVQYNVNVNQANTIAANYFSILHWPL